MQMHEEYTEIDSQLPRGSVLHGKSYDYVVERKLGQGSFGITYLVKVRMKGELGAIDTNVQMVVKEFFMDNVNGRTNSTVVTGSDKKLFLKYKEKFEKEALNISKLKHPNIIKVVENFSQNNTVYYSMEYISGGNLNSEILNNKGLSQQRTVIFALQICKALEFMHSNGMLHLDLKPSNIVIEGDRLILIDFGLSKQFDDNGDPESSTNIGGGTSGFAPIEQAVYHPGDGLPVTMDIYALGATMFKMLTGSTPPNASILINEDFPIEVLEQSDCSPELAAVIRKCMEPMKKNRYQKVTEVTKDLEKISNHTINEGNNIENDKSPKNNGEYSHIDDNSISGANSSKELLTFPDKIIIRLAEKFSRGYTYEFVLNEAPNSAEIDNNYVKIWKDGELCNKHFFGYCIPRDVVDFIKTNGYLNPFHWESAGSTDTFDNSERIFSPEIVFDYGNGEPFVRKVENASKEFGCKLLRDVEHLIYQTSLYKEISPFVDGNSPREDNSQMSQEPRYRSSRIYNEREGNRTLEYIKILPKTNHIEFLFLPPSFLACAYRMRVEPRSVYLADISQGGKTCYVRAPLSGNDYNRICEFIQSLTFIRNPKIFDSLEYSEPSLISKYIFSVSLYKRKDCYASFRSELIAGKHYGSLEGVPTQLSENLQSLIPGFGQLMAQATQKMKAQDEKEPNKEEEVGKEVHNNGVAVNKNGNDLQEDTDEKKNSFNPMWTFIILILLLFLLWLPVYLWVTVKDSLSPYFIVTLTVLMIGVMMFSFSGKKEKSSTIGGMLMVYFGMLYVILWIVQLITWFF